jgi:molybdate transport system permease protein
MRPAGVSAAALPRWIYGPAAVGVAFLALPLFAMAAKVDWPRFGSLITSPASRTALLLSLRTALASTLLCVVLGVPLALVLARHRGRVIRLVRPLVLVPLVLPPVVGGLALLYVFGRLGLLGHYLEAMGVRVAFTTTAVVLAQAFVSLPFLVIALEGAARTAGTDYDRVAVTGARVGVGCGIGLRAGAGGVRRHPDLRRIATGRHPHHASGDLPAA